MTTNNIQLSYNGTCGADTQAQFHGSQAIDNTDHTSTNAKVSPYQVVIRQKQLAGAAGTISHANPSDTTVTGIDDLDAKELANLVNAWFTRHEHGSAGGDAEISGIYIHITFKA